MCHRRQPTSLRGRGERRTCHAGDGPGTRGGGAHVGPGRPTPWPASASRRTSTAPSRGTSTRRQARPRPRPPCRGQVADAERAMPRGYEKRRYLVAGEPVLSSLRRRSAVNVASSRTGSGSGTRGGPRWGRDDAVIGRGVAVAPLVRDAVHHRRRRSSDGRSADATAQTSMATPSSADEHGAVARDEHGAVVRDERAAAREQAVREQAAAWTDRGRVRATVAWAAEAHGARGPVLVPRRRQRRVGPSG